MAKTRQSWLKFEPGAWRSDPNLKMCSLAARGLWIEMCGLMHEADPYGHLLVGGKKIEIRSLAALVGRPLDEVEAAFAELEDNEVFSRNRDGVIYSRRLTRMHKKAEMARKNGKLGGNPKLGNNTTFTASDKVQPTLKMPEQLIPEDAPSLPMDLPVPSDAKTATARKREANKKATELMIKIWNEVCGDVLPRCEILSDKSRKAMLARAHDEFHSSTKEWRAYCERVRASTFLRGESGRESWRGATLDWVVTASNCTKVLNGHYDDRKGNGTPGGTMDPELNTPYGRALLAWNNGGKEGPRPKREDFANANA